MGLAIEQAPCYSLYMTYGDLTPGATIKDPYHGALTFHSVRRANVGDGLFTYIFEGGKRLDRYPDMEVTPA
jgi:hypothetical protein